MANRVAPYKQSNILQVVQDWWDTADPPFYTIEEMFRDYTSTQLDDKPETIMDFVDFQRVVYKLGIRRIGTAPRSPYMQADTWRPSDDQTMRLEV